jgi:hypothetical protein
VWIQREGVHRIKLGREESNLQLPKARTPRAQRGPKRRKNLTDPADRKQAPTERKTDYPETVTQPSPPAAPLEDL